MRKSLLLLVCAAQLFSQTASEGAKAGRARSSAATASPTHHLFNPAGTLTVESPLPARAIAEQFLRETAALQGLHPAEIESLYLVKEYRSEHNGVTHFVYRQRYLDVEVEGSDFVVNIDSEGRVLNAGGSLYRSPAKEVPASLVDDASRALARAAEEVNPGMQTSFLPERRSLTKEEKHIRFSRGGFAQEIEGKPVWFPVEDELRSAWVFFIPETGRAGLQRLTVEVPSSKVLARSDMAQYQSAQPPARGLVFERNSPQPNAATGTLVKEPRPYAQRTLQSFAGDPVASPKGWVDGIQTVGNNTIAGHNPIGIVQLTTPVPATAPDRNFSFPLELGPGAPNPTNFKDAATTNLFYWINKAHDMFYAIGFNEAAGNFQQDNFGRGGIGGDPVLAYSQFGIASPGFAELDNAFFLANRDAEDGARISVNMFLGGYGTDVFTDGSYDSDIIIHEYTHGVSTRLVRNLRTPQGGAMGEAWSDFFSLEFNVPEGGPVDGAYARAEYLYQMHGVGNRTRPYSTNMLVNPLTFADYGRVIAFGPEVHSDGEIWANTLWEARANLIKQFGEREGRRRIRLLVLDGMKLAPPSPSMIDARDAILLADRVNFKGESQAPLWAAFAKRGFGVTAQTTTPSTLYVSAAHDLPSNTGQLRFYHPDYAQNERVDLVLHDGNNTSPMAHIQVTTSTGDVESLSLRKQGEVYVGNIWSASDGTVVKGDGVLDVIPADFLSAYYVDHDTGSGSKLIQTTVPTSPSYSLLPLVQTQHFISGQERPMFQVGTSRSLISYERITLPFAFPFYGRSYRTAYVHGDGRVSFDIPSLAPCNSGSAAAGMIGLFPMWMELVYGGRAQAGENVYYSSGPGSVTIRWAAETITTGEPVNFSIVLREDGRAVFQYGSGNNNLVNSNILGCPANGPLIGISNGRGSYPLLHVYSGRPNLERTTAVEVQPPFGFSSFPVVQLESPTPGSNHQGLVRVKGIAYDDSSIITRIDVIVDGVARRMILPNQRREDFCTGSSVRGCPNVGFNTLIDAASMGLAPGSHTIQLRVTTSRGAFVNYPEQPVPFNVQEGQSSVPVGRIEVPGDGTELSDLAVIRGYVYAPDIAIVAVDVIIDGVTYGPASYGARRDDICSPLRNGPPNCPGVGFSFVLDTLFGFVQLPNGKHFLQVRARDESGRFTLIPEKPIEITVDNEPNARPIGVLTTPAPNARLKGTVRVEGYAYDPDGRIRSVELLIDGDIFGPLTYGAERLEVCSTLPNVGPCPRIGFAGDLDTMLLSNGVHSLGILIRDMDGAYTIVPALSGFGMNVVVEN